ncbi:MAG: 50S ribosomal protein L33 [Candidatus Shikimatogenerans bostrichidophilus]|nr:MAG: 50S ribosomal protein L33 [Candidatus Shikimatogenerans bostrichidophilus]
MSKNRKIIILQCIYIKKNKKKISRYYTSKNIINNKKKIILNKYNPYLRKRTLHKEI